MIKTSTCIIILTIFVNLSLASPIKAEYKVGAILSLSGDAAFMGTAGRNGITLATESMSSEDRARISVRVEDDGLVSLRTVSAFKKLMDADQINGAICFSSGSCNAIAPQAEAAHLPLIAVASDANVSRNKKFVVNFWVTPEAETEILVNEAVRLAYRRVAIITSQHDGAYAVRDAFLKGSTGKIEVALNEEAPPEAKDFRTLITRIRALKDVDAVLANVMPGGIGVFAKQLREAGVKLPLFGYELFESPDDVKTSAGGLLGAWFATGSNGGMDFVSRFRARFPDSSLVTANITHDAVLLFAEAAKRDPRPEAVAEYLRTVKNFSGASGTFSATGDNRFSLPAVLKVVTKDGFEELR